MTYRLLPIKDLCISEYFPSKNYSSQVDSSLFMGRYRQDNDKYRTLLQFDLDKLGTQEIQKAYLQLNITRNESAVRIINLGIYRILDGWDASLITWDTMIPFSPVPEHRFVIPAGWQGLLLLDISVLVHNCLNHNYVNHGFILIGEEYYNSLLAFSSRREENPDSWPRLIITGISLSSSDPN
ncbi:MAG: DNRLRE domain-containing protein [Syntrophomonadaceae bacterium]|nr:DNRLRE domain-containing protein [Syntrophomonadaceae bacterium]